MASLTAGELAIILKAQDDASGVLKSFAANLRDVDQSVQQSNRSFSMFGGGLTGAFAKFSIMSYGVKNLSQAVVGGAQALFSYNAGLEQTTVAFKGLTGSAQGAQQLMQNLRNLAASTPLELNQVTTSAQRLLGVGVQAQQIPQWLTDIGDAAMAMGGGAPEIDRVTLAITQMAARGNIDGQDMLQIAQANVNAWGALSKATGLTTAQLQAMSQKGLLPASQYLPKLVQGFEQLYGGQMQAQAHTFNGMISSISDNLHQAFGKVSMPIFKVAEDELNKFLAYTNTADFSRLTDRLTAGVQSFANQLGPFLENDIPRMASSLATAAGDAEDVGRALKTVYDYASDVNNALGGQGWKLLASLAVGAKIGGKLRNLVPQGTAGVAGGEAGSIIGKLGTMTVMADVVNVTGAVSNSGLGNGGLSSGEGGVVSGEVTNIGGDLATYGITTKILGSNLVTGALYTIIGDMVTESVLDILTHGAYKGPLTHLTNFIGQSHPVQGLKNLFNPFDAQGNVTSTSQSWTDTLRLLGLVPPAPTAKPVGPSQPGIYQGTHANLPDAKMIQDATKYLNGLDVAQTNLSKTEAARITQQTQLNKLMQDNTTFVTQNQTAQDKVIVAAIKDYHDMGVAVAHIVSAQQGLAATYQVTLQVQSTFKAQGKEYKDSLKAVGDAIDAIHAKQQAGIPLTAQETAMLKNQADAEGRLKGGMQDATIAQGAAAEAGALLMKGQDALNKVMHNGNATWQDYVSALGVANQYTGEANQVLGHTSGTVDSLTQTFEGLSAQVQGQVVAALQAASQHVDQLNGSQIKILIQVLGEAELDRIRGIVSQGLTLPVYVNYVGGQQSAAVIQGLGNRATGGTVGPNEALTLVGELGPELAIYPYASGGIVGANGPEILKLPTGTQILTAAQTAQILGSSTPAASDLAQAIVTGAGKDLSRIPAMMAQINAEVMVQVEKLKNNIKSELDKSILSGDDAKTIQGYKDQLAAIGRIETDWAKQTGTSVGSVISTAVKGALSDQSWTDITQNWSDTLSGAYGASLANKIGAESRQLFIARAKGASQAVIDAITKQLAQDQADFVQVGNVMAESISDGLLQDTVWQNDLNNITDLITGKLGSDAFTQFLTDADKLDFARQTGADPTIMSQLTNQYNADKAKLVQLGEDMGDAIKSGVVSDQVWATNLNDLPDLVSGKAYNDALAAMNNDLDKLGYARETGASKTVMDALTSQYNVDKEALAEQGRDMQAAIRSGLVDQATWQNDLSNINDLVGGTLLSNAEGQLLTDQNRLKLAIASGAEQPIVDGYKAAVAADQAQIKQIGADAADAFAQGIASPDQWKARISDLSGLMDGTLMPQLKDNLKTAQQELAFAIAIGAPQAIIDGLQNTVNQDQAALTQAGEDYGAAVKAGLIKSLQLSPGDLNLVGNINGVLGTGSTNLVQPMLDAVVKGTVTVSQAASLMNTQMAQHLPQIAQQELQQLAQDMLAGKDTSGDLQQLQALQRVVGALGTTLDKLSTQVSQQQYYQSLQPGDVGTVPWYSTDIHGNVVQVGTQTKVLTAGDIENLREHGLLGGSGTNGKLDDAVSQAIQQGIQAATTTATTQTTPPASGATTTSSGGTTADQTSQTSQTATNGDLATSLQQAMQAANDAMTSFERDLTNGGDALTSLVTSLSGADTALDGFVASLGSSARQLGKIIASIPAGGEGGGATAMAEGGTLWEPVAGIGLRTGRRYLMGERGPEDVVPRRGGRRIGGGTSEQPLVVNVNVGNERLDAYLGSFLRRNISIGGS